MRVKKVVIIILATSFPLLVILIIFSWVLNDSALVGLAGADYVLRVIGNSMHPALRTNDLMLVKEIQKIDIEEIQIGDILCFWRWTQEGEYCLVAHRVIEIQIYPSWAVKTKGDKNQADDGWILREEILGKEFFTVPYGFYLTNNTVLLSAMAILILILLFLNKNCKKRRWNSVLDIRRIFEKIFTIVGVVFLFYHIIWLNIGRRFLFIIQKYYCSFWEFVKNNELVIILFFLGFVVLAIVLVIIFLIPLYGEVEKIEKEPPGKKDPF